LANNELVFMILEGPMIMIAVFALTAFHPGFCFGWALGPNRFVNRKSEKSSAVCSGPVISVTEVKLARVLRALEARSRGVVASRGAGKGRLWRKGSRKGVD